MPRRIAKKLLLIGWDAADWKMMSPLMDGGLMPTLARFVEQGCMGNIATLRPSLSPMLWTSIATGKLADQHGVTGFVEPTPDRRGVRLVGSQSRRAKAFWNITSEAGLKTHLVGWYASHPAEPISGACVSDRFVIDSTTGQRPAANDWACPTDLADRFAALRVWPRELGAGDLLPFVPRLEHVDLRRDPRPGKLAEALSACATTHAIATDLLANHDWDVAAVYYDTIDRLGHEFMPYHAPRLDHISEADFSIYQHVMTGVYRFHDMLLERLLDIAGDDATVILVSDHGFHCDHLRPNAPAGLTEAQTAALWHRHYGALAMRGPGILADERVYGATLLDVAPTILMLLGLPIGRDMPGRALVQALKDPPPELEFVPTWETSAHPASAPADADPGASAAAIRQLIDLGYLAPDSLEAAALVEQADRESKYNLAVVHLSTGRPRQAIAPLRELVSSRPREFRYVITLATALAAAGEPADVCALLEPLESQGLSHPDVDAALGAAYLKLGQTEAAVARLSRAESSGSNDPALFCLVGEARLAQRGLADAERAYRRAIAIDPDSDQGHYGLARALYHAGQYEASAEHALRAVGLVHAFPHAHYVLGLALAAMGDDDRAILSIRQAVQLYPPFREAHQRLAELLLKRGDVEAAMRHRRAADGYAVDPPA